jgi:tetratricopeptide (TPR) repeat protein
LFWIGLGIGCLLGLIVYTAVLRKPPTPSESGTQAVDTGKDLQRRVFRQLPNREDVEWALAKSQEEASTSASHSDFEIDWSKTTILTGNDEEDIARYRQELEENPDSFIALVALGSVLADHYPEEAIGYLKRAIQIDKKAAYVYTDLANIYLKLGQLEDAEAIRKKRDELGLGTGYGGVYLDLSNVSLWGPHENSLPTPDHTDEQGRESSFDE